MEQYFSKFRQHIIGIDQKIKTPYHKDLKITYTDWTASGRNYKLIEDKIQNELMPFVANTHTETNDTGMAMTYAYHLARNTIKKHVNAKDSDVIITCGSGMTGVVNKFQRILGLKIHENFSHQLIIKDEDKPIILISHMEHHSNQTSWLETIADVEIVKPCSEGLISIENFEKTLQKHAHRKTKIVSITACSNVTGICTPYHKIAQITHKYNGLCFVDFACSAPYLSINMHPENPEEKLDAIFFSPHKFLGGPGSSGVLIFDHSLYQNTIPDCPGGGTVDWTNPWGKHKYVDNIEDKEDGGTPAFIQTIKTALCVKLKEEMGVENMIKREEELIKYIFEHLKPIKNLHILAEQHINRLGVISFYIDGLHYNLAVKILNDRFGIQTRGGCSCAGTYGHYLLNVQPDQSNEITKMISEGNCSLKPGWVRMSIHPTLTNKEIEYTVKAIIELSEKFTEWAKDYNFDNHSNKISAKDNSSEIALKQQIDKCLTEGFY